MPITDNVMADALATDAVLFGAVGGPKWDNVSFDKKPERGLLRLRKEMGLFANLRPATVFEALADASTLKREVVAGLDIMIVRELTGGVYFGEPRGIETLPDGSKRGIDTQVYTTPEIERIAPRRLRARAQALQQGLLGREGQRHGHRRAVARDDDQAACRVQGRASFRTCTPTTAPCSSCATRKQFDVIVTDNLFGDMLSDCAAMLTGSLGMLPSASLGAADATGRRKALYEPMHGSAPDIAGKDLANPLATLLCFAMMLRYSFDLADDADLIEKAAKGVLKRASAPPTSRSRARRRSRPRRWATRS